MRKKAQEEIVGFALILVLVAVIALIFLGISLRKPIGVGESKNIENFLEASLIYTTTCQPNAENIYDLKGLISACYRQDNCLDGEDSCSVLNQTIIRLVESSFNVQETSVIKGYRYSVKIQNNTFTSWENGIKTGEITAGESSLYSSGDKLSIRLELYS